MHFLLLAKYPPIVGGLATVNYWKAWLLAQAGVKITIVTNADEVSKAHGLIWQCSEALPNVRVKYLSKSNHYKIIPRSQAYVTRLVSVSCSVLETEKIDFIEASYLEPNGASAVMLSQWFGLPYGIKHAGSDVGKLLDGIEYSAAYQRILSNADYILTGKNHIC